MLFSKQFKPFLHRGYIIGIRRFTLKRVFNIFANSDIIVYNKYFFLRMNSSLQTYKIKPAIRYMAQVLFITFHGIH